jgi:hypothetical protein
VRLTGGVQDVLALRAYAPGAKLLVVCDDDATPSLDYARAGADGVLSKRATPAAILTALRALLGDVDRRGPSTERHAGS